MPILNCPIRTQAISAPDTVAVYLPENKITYAELDLLICNRVEELQRQGIGNNVSVAFCVNNCLTLVVSLFATIRLGAIFCPLSHLLPAEEINKLVKQTGIGYLWHFDNLNIAGITPLTLDDDSFENKDQLKSKVKTNIPINGSAAATIIFTSGSTGQPKAAVHSLNNHYYSALGSQTVVQLDQNDCWLASLPINHIGGLAIIFRCFFAGASIALVERKKLFQSLQKYPITHASLVPTQLYRLLGQCQQNNYKHTLNIKVLSKEALKNNIVNKPALKLSHLLLGGAPISRSLLAKATALGFNTFYSYGLTEMCSQVATCHANNQYFSAPLPYRQWKLVNDEIALCGETLFLGYMSKGKIKSPCINGWFYSKDLAELTPEGLKIFGRKDNMFIVGGENYQPETIEKKIIDSPMVENALIVSLDDAEFGVIPVAFIDWANSPDIPALKAYLTGKVSRIQIPKHFICWPTKTTETFKPNRKWYQQQAVKLNQLGIL